jgi:hypothetical protein
MQTFSWRRSVALAACAFYSVAGMAAEGKSTGPVVVLPPSVPGLPDAKDRAGYLYFPSHEYRSGTGWWALVCAGITCSLQPGSMEVTPMMHEQSTAPPSDGAPRVPGQALVFSPPTPNGTRMLFKAFKAPADKLVFRPGSVPTYHPGYGSRQLRNKEVPNVAETEVELPGDHLLRIVPTPEYELMLVLDGRRQKLGEFDPGADVVDWKSDVTQNTSGYLVWAGDLDGDGRPDLLVNFWPTSAGDYAYSHTLFLSSLAKPGKLVGEAGRFSYCRIELASCFE